MCRWNNYSYAFRFKIGFADDQILIYFASYNIIITALLYWNNPKVDPLPILAEMRKKFATDKVKAEYLKINLDGSEEVWNGLFSYTICLTPFLLFFLFFFTFSLFHFFIFRQRPHLLVIKCHSSHNTLLLKYRVSEFFESCELVVTRK